MRDKKEFKYCVRFTEEEYNKFVADMRANNYRSMSMYMRALLFDRHVKYPVVRSDKTPVKKIANTVMDIILSAEEDCAEINKIARTINRRNELTKDGAPVKYGGMAYTWALRYSAWATKLQRKLSKINKTIYVYEKLKK